MLQGLVEDHRTKTGAEEGYHLHASDTLLTAVILHVASISEPAGPWQGNHFRSE
jgi:hypothetical protein